MFVYVITNHTNGKLYIGKTITENLDYYLSRQFWCARNPDKSRTSKPHLFNAMRKYPSECWSIYPLISNIKTHDELLHWEQVLIKALGTQKYGYNICAGGRGTIGWKPSPETRAKQSASNQGKHRERLLSPENQAVRVAAWQQALDNHGGSFHTAETADKIKEARAAQDESYRLEKQKEYERLHPERRVRAAATHRGMKHKMSVEGSEAISEGFKRGNRKRWSTHTLTGQTFGRLTVGSQAGRSDRGLILWHCSCSCGNSTIGRTDLLRNGHKQSCGCLAKEARRVKELNLSILL